jgi:endonuclease/exonuclease/phosphatase family metal-dependent hydrolase
MPPYTGIGSLRVATYNIHKGVRGIGPRKRLEIHNLGLAVEALDADLVFLQEVRLFNRRDALHFDRTYFGWPEQGQAEFLAPLGYESAYRTNAVTRHGEHGNALLSRWPMGDIGHHDVSDHRFEQRGLLHVPVNWNGSRLHAVVVHLGLVHASRVRQVERLADFIARGARRRAAGGGRRLQRLGRKARRADGRDRPAACTRAPDRSRALTFPSLMPVFALDRFYLRGLGCRSTMVPRGTPWARMSDHLPLVAELEPL